MASTGSSVVLNVRLTTIMPAGSSSLLKVDSAWNLQKYNIIVYTGCIKMLAIDANIVTDSDYCSYSPSVY